MIGTKVLVRNFEQRSEIRDLRTQPLLHTYTRVDRPGDQSGKGTKLSHSLTGEAPTRKNQISKNLSQSFRLNS